MRAEWMMVVKALPPRTDANCICILTSSPRPKVLPQIFLIFFFNLSSFSYLLNLIIYKHFKYKNKYIMNKFRGLKHNILDIHAK